MSAGTSVSPAGASAGADGRVELAISGMTCASCAARVEKKLNKLDGVTATVNFATETARVGFPAAVSVNNLISVVEQAGYTAAVPPGGSGGMAPPGRGVTGGSPPGGKHRRPRCGSGCWWRWR